MLWSSDGNTESELPDFVLGINSGAKFNSRIDSDSGTDCDAGIVSGS